MKKHIILILVFCLWSAISHAQTQPPAYAVVSAHPLATQAGKDILKEGGNAFDAAIAVSAMLSVVEPFGSGLGGGGFWLTYDAQTKNYSVIDARETAPIKATADMYLDETGNPVKGASTNGPLAAAIPGLPAAFVTASQQFANLPLSQSLKPAIEIAQNGFPIDERYIEGASFKENQLRANPAAAAIFLDNGKVPEAGWILKQPDLAQTLEKIAKEGKAGFYKGEIAQNMVQDITSRGGIWTLEDLAEYKTIIRKPLIINNKGAKIIMPSLPSSGGLVIGNILNILSGYEKLNKHLIIEAMKQGYQQRAQYMGDSDFVVVPVQKILSGENADEQRMSISPDKATPSAPLALEAEKGTETTHFAVIDAQGNRVAVTQSINFWFGSGFVPQGTGVLLNNEMDDFTLKPGVENGYGLQGTSANVIAPKKRMLSSMTPTFVETDKGILILGTPGGSRIISMNLLAILDFLDGKDPKDIIAAPRYHHQYMPDIVTYEEGAFTDKEIKDLTAKGHKLDKASRPYGNMQMIFWDFETNTVKTYSDPRGNGKGEVY